MEALMIGVSGLRGTVGGTLTPVVVNQMIAAFTAANPGIAVKVETAPFDQYFTKLQTLIAGGTAGDVWYSLHRNTPRFVQNKVIMPLDDLVAAEKFDLSQYYPSAIAASKRDGQLYALPFKVHPGPAAMFYNVKQVQEWLGHHSAGNL